jgi:hypothetical protein
LRLRCLPGEASKEQIANFKEGHFMNSYTREWEKRRVIPFPRTLAAIASMTRKAFACAVVPACIAFLLAALTAPAFGQAAVGLVGGITRDSASGKPVGGSQITAHNLDKGTEHTTVADASGIFTFTNLEPGQYEFAATKTGFQKSSARVEVIARRTARVDLSLQAANAQAADASASLAKELEAMKARIEQLEGELRSKQTPAESSAPAPSAEPIADSGRTILRPNAEASAPIAGPAASAVASLPDATAKPFDIASAAPLPPTQVAAPSAPQEPSAPAPPDTFTPFADYDWTWLNGNPRNHDVAFDSKFFTPEIRADLTYTYDFNKPSDDSMGGSSELFRSNEIQLEQLGIGGDFHWDNVRARFMTQFGEYSEATIRNDGSYNKGQWNLNDADRYLAEAYGGYHINWMHGMNIDAGIFMSYVGLFSYYNFDNWAYQPSYVSSNTPWFFQGIRIQMFPTNHLKIEPWIINGWQSYASANTRKGLGGQIKYTPFPWLNIISNNYGLGHDDLYIPNRSRIHTDNSIEIKYYDKPESKGLSKMAVSITGDLGCEFGGGVSCHGDTKGGPKQSFVGYMVYNRLWFHKDMFGLTIGGGQINNPGRYLVLVPPINGETAGSAALNSPYFTFNPGDPFKAWDVSATFDYMPRQWITFRFEGDYRHANVPYWSGAGGVTPPPFLGGAPGTNNGQPTQYACMDGSASGSTSLTPGLCSQNGGVWYPDLRRDEVLFDIDLMVKF